MGFYTSISKYYDYIFPYKPMQLDFLMNNGLSPEDKVLDIGCGTGNLALAVADQGCNVQALDYDHEMIAMAKNKTTGNNPEFIQLDMLKIVDHYDEESFDFAYCFGNTIVHLLSDEKIRLFLQGIKQVLKPKGTFFFQLLNYENIRTNDIRKLPLIENDRIRFERTYEFNGPELVDFITILTIKSSGKTITNRINLYPLTKTKLSQLLTASGFENINYYSSFEMTPLNRSSLPLVGSCQLGV